MFSRFTKKKKKKRRKLPKLEMTAYFTIDFTENTIIKIENYEVCCTNIFNNLDEI